MHGSERVRARLQGLQRLCAGSASWMVRTALHPHTNPPTASHQIPCFVSRWSASIAPAPQV